MGAAWFIFALGLWAIAIIIMGWEEVHGDD